jgi:hypothetical protein
MGKNQPGSNHKGKKANELESMTSHADTTTQHSSILQEQVRLLEKQHG